MPDEEDLEVAFKKDAVEPEVEYVPEAELPPAEDPDAALPEDVKKKTKKELYEELKAKAAAVPPAPDMKPVGDAIAAALEKVGNRPAAPVALPGETEEQFLSRVKVDLFDENKVGKTLKDVVDRYASPMIAQQAQTAYQTQLKLMRLDPETGGLFKKYEKDVLEYAARSFPGYERTPQAIELAFERVRALHITEEIEEKAKARVEEELKKREAEGVTRPAPKRTPLSLEGSGRSQATSATEGPAVKKVGWTKEDERLAEKRGVHPSVIAARRARSVS